MTVEQRKTLLRDHRRIKSLIDSVVSSIGDYNAFLHEALPCVTVSERCGDLCYKSYNPVLTCFDVTFDVDDVLFAAGCSGKDE